MGLAANHHRTLNLDQVRAEFPALQSDAVYLDNASGSQVLRRVADPTKRTTFGGIPTREVLKLLAGLVQSQLPHHRPGDVATPDWFHTWMDSYAAGEDMAHYYGLAAK